MRGAMVLKAAWLTVEAPEARSDSHGRLMSLVLQPTNSFLYHLRRLVAQGGTRLLGLPQPMRPGKDCRKPSYLVV